jgi:hypothetical protein
MRRSAKEKGIRLVGLLHIIAAIFLGIVFLLRELLRAHIITLDTAVLLSEIYCIFTAVIFIYKIYRGFFKYFYAFIMVSRDSAMSGRVGHDIIFSILLMLSVYGSFYFISSFDKIAQSFFDGGSVRLLFAANLAAGGFIIVAGIWISDFLRFVREIRR